MVSSRWGIVPPSSGGDKPYFWWRRNPIHSISISCFNFNLLFQFQFLVSTMQTIKICPQLLPRYSKKFRYMASNGEFDYLGQILYQLGFNIPPNAKTPQDLDQLIPNFTFACRGTYINTVLTLRILRLDRMPKDLHKQYLIDILSPHYNVEWVDQIPQEAFDD